MNDLNRARIRLEQHKTNHILHLLLSFFTIGIWIIFWMMIASSNTTNRNVINRKYGLPEESNLVGSGCLLLIVLFIMGAVIGFVESNDPNETPSEDSFIDLAPNPFAYPQSEDSFIDLAPNPFTNSQGVKSV
ncbi:MAG TPA: hypothetical protein EYQ26_12435, partial [Rhodospirillales bacterium]|nr:hypothetical protein [Rhodospirillales bacterium]